MRATGALDWCSRLAAAVDGRRLLETARRLVAVPSPTGAAGAAADCLAGLLRADGVAVERPEAGHPAAPAVVVHLGQGRPGRTLQFDGHLDTVHLPFVAPAVVDGRLTGSGAADMKAGLAAAVEAVRALREVGLPEAGSVMLTAHDLREAPWGRGQQLDRLLQDGVVGDGLLIPEPLCDRLPTVGRGAATWMVVAFQHAFVATSGRELPVGPKPFVDDSNCFWALRRVPAITHGPRAGGQRTVAEWVEIDDLVGVARLYALTAALYCAALP
jgi:acetylornithine deacetylase/succinyl-diaminopimelate desuccinylase-like protein